MPSLADFFLGCFYLIVLAIVLAACVTIIGTAWIELRKRIK